MFRRWTAEGKSRPPPLLGFKERETFRRHGWKPPKKQNWPGHAAVFQQRKIRFKALALFYYLLHVLLIFTFPSFSPACYYVIFRPPCQSIRVFRSPNLSNFRFDAIFWTTRKPYPPPRPLNRKGSLENEDATPETKSPRDFN